jgi:hypothetical protein
MHMITGMIREPDGGVSNVNEAKCSKGRGGGLLRMAINMRQGSSSASIASVAHRHNLGARPADFEVLAASTGHLPIDAVRVREG